jgi:hypothetical protein
MQQLRAESNDAGAVPMSEHDESRRATADRGDVKALRHADHRAHGEPALIQRMQQLAGNSAVSAALQQSGSVAVQREPFGARPAHDDQYKLHLDPQIEAQIRAITAMNTMIAPEPVRTALLDLTLPLLATPVGPPAPAPQLTLPVPEATSTPPPPAAGTELVGPRAGTGGDIWKAVVATPAFGPLLMGLGEQAAARVKTDFSKLSMGGTAMFVGGSIAVGGGAIVSALANTEARQWITATLNDKIIPVPKVPGLSVQLNLSGPTIIVGLHLDVGKLLPAALGFGPASTITPLGAPPDQSFGPTQ